MKRQNSVPPANTQAPVEVLPVPFFTTPSRARTSFPIDKATQSVKETAFLLKQNGFKLTPKLTKLNIKEYSGEFSEKVLKTHNILNTVVAVTTNAVLVKPYRATGEFCFCLFILMIIILYLTGVL